MQELINIEDKMKKLKDYLIDQHDIMVCYLFGSYGTEYQTSLSDIDFAILFKEELEVNLMREMEIMAELSLILGVEDIDLFNLNKAPIYLQRQLLPPNQKQD